MWSNSCRCSCSERSASRRRTAAPLETARHLVAPRQPPAGPSIRCRRSQRMSPTWAIRVRSASKSSRRGARSSWRCRAITFSAKLVSCRGSRRPTPARCADMSLRPKRRQVRHARRLLSTSAFAVRCLNPRVVAVWLRLQCNSARPAARQASAAADVRRGRQSSCDGENWRPSRWRSGHAGGGAGPRRAGRDHNLPYGRRTTATYACCRHRTSTPQHSTTHTRSRAHRTRYVCSKDSSLCDLSLYSRARRLAALTLSITWYCMLI
jgi:hypothetical protein